MSHIVKCPFCDKQFDRDQEMYVLHGKRRYAHAACATRYAIQHNLKAPEIIDPNDVVICYYCKKQLKRESPECVMIYDGVFAHRECEAAEQKRELTDEEKLYKYLKTLFDSEYVPPIVLRQIKEFQTKYSYSYSGMLKALIYAIEITKKMKIDKTHPSVNFMPYIYQDAYNYYYNLWLAEQANDQKEIKIPEIEHITIKSPKRERHMTQYFSFLLEDDINGI